MLVSFFSIFYLVSRDALKEYEKETVNQLNLIENQVYASISNAKQVLDGLSYLISKTDIKLKNQEIFEIIKNFDPQSKSFKAIPFSSLVILDTNNLSIASSTEDISSFKQKDFSEAKCIQNIKENHSPNLHIGLITTGLYSKELIIPLGILISKDQKFLGSICTGLSVVSLKSYMGNIKLYNLFSEIDLVNKADKRLKFYTINKFFNLSNVLKYILLKEEPKIIKSITNYPYDILASVRLDNLYLSLKAKLIVCFYYSLLFISCLVVIFIIIKKFYSNPFNYAKEMILKLPERILSKAVDQNFHLHEVNSSNITPKALNDTIVHLTRQLQMFYENEEKSRFEQHMQGIRKKVLQLALIEQHYSPLEKVARAKNDLLYKNFIITLINEEPQNMSLEVYFSQILDYFKEYFYEMNIKLKFDDNRSRSFCFKYSALTETIFHIFSFIQRSAIGFEEDNLDVMINAHFKEQDSFPTISINTTFDQNTQRSLGWEAGAQFPYMSLLSICVLAKENNLAFDIEQEDSKLVFILKPFTLNELYQLIL
ncbi:MAG: hypothetical protein WBJ81_00180 [Rickettsiales bacterium]